MFAITNCSDGGAVPHMVLTTSSSPILSVSSFEVTVKHTSIHCLNGSVLLYASVEHDVFGHYCVSQLYAAN